MNDVSRVPQALPPNGESPRQLLERLYRAAVDRALPLQNMARYLPDAPPHGATGRTMVVGAGKAAVDQPIIVSTCN